MPILTIGWTATMDSIHDICHQSDLPLEEFLALSDLNFQSLSRDVLGNGALLHARAVQQLRQCLVDSEGIVREGGKGEGDDDLPAGGGGLRTGGRAHGLVTGRRGKEMWWMVILCPLLLPW